MAKRLSFPRRERTRRKVRAPFNAGTFIQRSRAESSEQKAMWNQVQGAGKSHVRREFFGLTDTETEQCREKLAAALQTRLEGLSR